jgi:hypothetical protein
LANSGKTVIVAALDGDYKRQPFEKTINLIPLSESVTKLTAICMNCRADAAFSRRLGAQTEVFRFNVASRCCLTIFSKKLSAAKKNTWQFVAPALIFQTSRAPTRFKNKCSNNSPVVS